MLDIDFILEHPGVVQRAIESKGVELDLDGVIALHGEARELGASQSDEGDEPRSKRRIPSLALTPRLGSK